MSPPGELTFILRLRLKAWHVGRGWMCPTLGNSTLYKRKKSARKKVNSWSRWTHAQSIIWAKTEPLATMRANAFHKMSCFQMNFQHVTVFHLEDHMPLCGKYLFLNNPMSCRCCNERTAVHYFPEFPPTIFWGSHAGEYLIPNPLCFSWHLHQSGVNYFHVNWGTKFTSITSKM